MNISTDTWISRNYHEEENKEPIFDGPITKEIMVNKLKDLKKKKNQYGWGINKRGSSSETGETSMGPTVEGFVSSVRGSPRGAQGNGNY